MATSNTTCCRSTQIYVNYGDNSRLDALGFAPFAQVISGMDVLDKLYSKFVLAFVIIRSQGSLPFRDDTPWLLSVLISYSAWRRYGEEVDQGSIYQDGSKYLKKNFPNLDYLLHATIVPK
jgi:cyclophilin family peptidyl-prolyl cis-trans isomerase